MPQHASKLLSGLAAAAFLLALGVSCGGSKTIHFVGSSGGDGAGGAAPAGCGDGVRNGSEECDDGNQSPGDGCSKQCTLEGSCTAPQVIALTADAQGDGLSGAASGSTQESDAKQVAAGDCGGNSVGSGSDRVFQVDLDNPGDLEVKVGSSFDAIVRILSSPCTLTDQLLCTDDAAVAATENAAIPNAPAGTYYIVVDGKSDTQAGDFSVNVHVGCPLENVRIDRVILQDPFRTQIVNYNSTCSVDLSRIGFYSQPNGTSSPTTLPERALPALGRVELTTANPPPTGGIFEGTIPFDQQGFAGALYLCRGACNTSTGANVYDAVRWKGTAGSLPGGLAAPTQVKFDAELPALTDRLGQSYFRLDSAGSFPNFKAADFLPAVLVETFEDGHGAWPDPPALFYTQTFENPTGTVGNFALALDGGNPASPNVWNGAKYTFLDNSGGAMVLQPTYVSLQVRASETTKNAGQIFFGSSGAENNMFGSLFRVNGTLAFAGPTVASFTPAYSANTWYHIEYKNFDYNAQTVGVFVDGTSRGTLTMSAAGARQLNIRNVDTTKIWVDQIIVQ